MELIFDRAGEEGDRRRFKRFAIQRKARYYLTEGSGCWKECTITSISRQGLGIRLRAGEKIKVGSTLVLRVFVLAEKEAASVIGIVRWIRTGNDDVIGGIESMRVLDDDHLYYSPLER